MEVQNADSAEGGHSSISPPEEHLNPDPLPVAPPNLADMEGQFSQDNPFKMCVFAMHEKEPETSACLAGASIKDLHSPSMLESPMGPLHSEEVGLTIETPKRRISDSGNLLSDEDEDLPMEKND
ncbi:uncharacterized protein [Scyliorhinus torazame]|uniref:uncharacterized protein isoform X2 n=1 Tax=Scyliorhinus torazame TaxID=75743 RepID=UPI003B5A988D